MGDITERQPSTADVLLVENFADYRVADQHGLTVVGLSSEQRSKPPYKAS